MTYKMICPDCGAKLSRFDYCTTPSIDYTCRKCATKFRMTAIGWLITSVVVALEMAAFTLYIMKILPPWVLIVFILGICALAVWLIPFLTPVKPVSSSKTSEGSS